jgi:hypothetical protein
MGARDPLLKKVDCVQIPVPDLDQGLRFYRDGLGLELKWRHATQAGLRLGDTELVLQTERAEPETDFLVDSADDASTMSRRQAAGCCPGRKTSRSGGWPQSPTRSVTGWSCSTCPRANSSPMTKAT